MSSATQNISQAQILDAVKQLPTRELENLVNQVLVLQARKRASDLSAAETKLLKNVYRKFSAEKLSRLRQLRENLETRLLSKAEYENLAALTDALEEFHARRMKNLAELAKMRGLGLEEMMARLGIRFPGYD